MSKIVIDLSELIVAKDKAGEFAINVEGQDHLVKLAEAKNQIDELYKTALQKLADQAFEYDKNVKLIDSHKVRVSFSRVGKKYQADIDKVEPEFVKTVKSLDTDRVGDYMKRHEELPKHVKLMPDNDRPLSIRLKVKDEVPA